MAMSPELGGEYLVRGLDERVARALSTPGGGVEALREARQAAPVLANGGDDPGEAASATSAAALERAEDIDKGLAGGLAKEIGISETEVASLLVAADAEYGVKGRSTGDVARLAAGILWARRESALRAALELLDAFADGRAQGTPEGRELELAVRALLRSPVKLVEEHSRRLKHRLEHPDPTERETPILGGEVLTPRLRPEPLWLCRRREAQLLAQCLLVACRIGGAQLAGGQGLEQLAGAFAACARHHDPEQAGISKDPSRQQALSHCGCAFIAALRPNEQEGPDRAIEALGGNPGERVREGFGQDSENKRAAAAAQLAWSALELEAGRASSENSFADAVRQGALTFWADQAGSEAVRAGERAEDVAWAVHTLACSAMASSSGQQGVEEAGERGISGLLEMLAAAYEIDPSLAGQCQYLGDLIAHTERAHYHHGAAIQSGIARLLGALAKKSEWAPQVFEKVGSHSSSSAAPLSWNKLQESIDSTCRTGQPGQLGCDGIEVHLVLLAKCVQGCPSRQNREEMGRRIAPRQGLEHALALLVAARVPAEVKAAAYECLASLATDIRGAELAWEGLRKTGATPNGSGQGVEEDMRQDVSGRLAEAVLMVMSRALEANIGADETGLVKAVTQLLGWNGGRARGVLAGSLQVLRLLVERGGRAQDEVVGSVVRESDCLEACAKAIAPGVEEERVRGEHGQAVERAAREALRLLNACTAVDASGVARAMLRGGREAGVLELARYPYEHDVQAEAIIFLHKLAESSDRFVPRLLASPHLSSAREGVASALDTALREVTTAPPGKEAEHAKTRVDNLLSLCLYGDDDGSRPPVCFLLAGLDHSSGGLLEPTRCLTTLTPLLERCGAETWRQVQRVPSPEGRLALTRAAEAGLHILCRLLDNPSTAEDAFYLVAFNPGDCIPGGGIASSLSAASSYPPPHVEANWAKADQGGASLEADDAWLAAASLGARARLLEAAARVLHAAAPEVDDHEETCEHFAAVLIGTGDRGGGALEAVSAQAGSPLPGWKATEDDDRNLRECLREASEHHPGGVWERGEHAEWVINIDALRGWLRDAQAKGRLTRYNDESVKELADRDNALREAVGARRWLLAAWQACGRALVGRRWGSLCSCLGGEEEAVGALCALLRQSVELAAGYADIPRRDAAEPAALALACASRCRDKAHACTGRADALAEASIRIAFLLAIGSGGEGRPSLFLALAESARTCAGVESLREAGIMAAKEFASRLAYATAEECSKTGTARSRAAALACVCACLDATDVASDALEAAIHAEKLPEAIVTGVLEDADRAAVSHAQGGGPAAEAGAQAMGLVARLAYPGRRGKSPEKLLEAGILPRCEGMASLLEPAPPSGNAQTPRARMLAHCLRACAGLASALPRSAQARQQVSSLLSRLRRPVGVSLARRDSLLVPSLAAIFAAKSSVADIPEQLDEAVMALLSAGVLHELPAPALASLLATLRAVLEQGGKSPIPLTSIARLVDGIVPRLKDTSLSDAHRRLLFFACSNACASLRTCLDSGSAGTEPDLRRVGLPALDSLLSIDPSHYCRDPSSHVRVSRRARELLALLD